MPLPHRLRLPLLLFLAVLVLGFGPCRIGGGFGSLFFHFRAPAFHQLSAEGAPLAVALRVPRFADLATLALTDAAGTPLDTSDFALANRLARAEVSGLGSGVHWLHARVEARILFFPLTLAAATKVELTALPDTDGCENLNAVECLLPFPSSRFLEPAATETGYRVRYPEGGLPGFPDPLDARNFDGQDGFSPQVQVLVHFPGAVDPAASGAARLLEETRSIDTRSLAPDSPTLLLDLDAGLEPVPHFIERDHRGREQGLEREVLFLRPAESLVPGHRYAVAFRNLVHPDGTAVTAEPVFAALRDGRPTTIAGVEAQRPGIDALLEQLEGGGIAREDLVLAFDFVVGSDDALTREVLAMRDRAFAWLAPRAGANFDVLPFVEEPAEDELASEEFDCDEPDQITWRRIHGTFAVPLFLSSDPLLENEVPGTLVDDDGDGLPDAQGTMDANFSITIPCAILADETPLRPLVAGHGLFQRGSGAVGFADGLSGDLGGAGLGGFDRITGATDYLGLSGFDFALPAPGLVTTILNDLDTFPALPDRLRQGVVNTLVLARMLKEAHFNGHPAFQTPSGVGVLAGPDADLDYLGISLGGIMGLFFTALSPDVAHVAVDIPASNFPMLVQRSGAIGLIGTFINFANPDPMAQALLWGLGGERWARAEPAGVLRRITRDRLPGSGPAPPILMTIARYDGIVANEASEIAARTMGLPNLRGDAPVAGSALPGFLRIENAAPPLAPGDPGFVGAQVWYDIAAYDPSDPAHQPFIPPLSNSPPENPGVLIGPCEPHGRTFSVRAERLQIVRWLQEPGEVAPGLPGEPGVIQNFCDGACDGFFADGSGPNPDELEGGRETPCDPLAP